MENPLRVELTELAKELLRKLTSMHGPLMFHQSGGCCDGSSPMCYPAGEFRVGGQDVKAGGFGSSRHSGTNWFLDVGFSI